ncbi:MAG: hypothetical protein BGO96_13545 [Micrococcales bacterium 73-15]|nr:MAG: hypothetical protein BGO96_13545 [Micrococcales bacterium 73-15]
MSSSQLRLQGPSGDDAAWAIVWRMTTAPTPDRRSTSDQEPHRTVALWRACWDTALHLAVVSGPDAGWAVPLVPGRDVLVGRGADAALRIADQDVWQRHLTVRAQPGGRVLLRRIGRAHVLLHRPRRRPVRGARRERAWPPHTATTTSLPSDGADAPADDARGRRSRRDPAGNAWWHGRPLRRQARIRPGTRIVLGSTTLEARGTPFRSPDRDGPASSSPPGRLPSPVVLLPLVAMLAVAATLAMRGGHGAPGYLLVGLIVSAASGVAMLVSGVRAASDPRPAAPPEPASRGPLHGGPPDPATVAVLAAGLGREGLTRAAGPPGEGARAGLVERAGPTTTRPEHGPATRRPPEGLLVTGPDGIGVARWLTVELELAGHDPAGVGVWPGPGACPPTGGRLVPSTGRPGVSSQWLAALHHALGPPMDACDLRGLLGRPGAAEIASAWARGRGDLAVPLGPGPDCVLDLAVDGPHALVVGTTGSGKSELLQAWVLALATRHPPRDVAFLLIDYKGGATFAHAAHLPHCVGLLTDLDPAGSRRALSALRHELRRRERVLGEAGVRDREAFEATGGTLGRLIVVVDELRALVEDDEDRLADLVAVATLGRSLGVHLVLATQRAGGVVSGQLRANLTLRVCLRVLEAGDALDVVGDPRPASFTTPGEASVGGREVRLAWLPGRAAAELAAAVVEAGERARRRRRSDLLRTHRPWLPPLPEAPTTGSVDGAVLLDRPEVPDHVSWREPGGHVLVSGPPRSGRSTALRALAAQALRPGRTRGRTGLVCSEPSGSTARVIERRSVLDAPPTGAGTPVGGRTPTDGAIPIHSAADDAVTGCHVLSREGWGVGVDGTVAGCDDPDVLARLLTHVASGGDPAALVVVDDVEHVVAAVDQVLGPGSGIDLVTALLTIRRSGRVVLAAGSPHRWTASVAHHLALGVRDAGTAATLGIGRDLVEPRPLPGRGVLLTDGRQRAAQVVPAPPVDRPHPSGATRPELLRLRPLPDLVTPHDLDRLVRDRSQPVHRWGSTASARLPPVPLGVGHAGLVEVEVPTRGALLVVGPTGSGRSTALARIADGLGATGVAVSRASPGRIEDVGAEGDGSPGRSRGGMPPGARGEAVLLVDDAELLAAEEVEALRPRLRGRCVVATTPSAFAGDFRGLVAAARDGARVLALGGFAPGRSRPPHGPPRPGRGLLVEPDRTIPVQVGLGVQDGRR